MRGAREVVSPHSLATELPVAHGQGSPPAANGDAIDAPETEFLTVSEVAARLRVTRNWVYNHADALGAVHLGKYLRFSWPRVLECLLQSRTKGQGSRSAPSCS